MMECGLFHLENRMVEQQYVNEYKYLMDFVGLNRVEWVKADTLSEAMDNAGKMVTPEEQEKLQYIDMIALNATRVAV